MADYDVECPYCGKGQEICHDNNYGFDEGVRHTQECSDCERMFAYYTSIVLSYTAKKAPCENGEEHQWEELTAYPWPVWRCRFCGETRRTDPHKEGNDNG